MRARSHSARILADLHGEVGERGQRGDRGHKLADAPEILDRQAAICRFSFTAEAYPGSAGSEACASPAHSEEPTALAGS